MTTKTTTVFDRMRASKGHAEWLDPTLRGCFHFGATEYETSLPTSVSGWSGDETMSDVASMEALTTALGVALGELPEVVATDVATDEALQAQLRVIMLSDAIHRRASRTPLMGWCIVTTYDPEGTFAPGKDVVWSAHTDKAEAERVLPLWDKYLNRPRDNIRVELHEAVVYQFKDTNYPGPRR